MAGREQQLKIDSELKDKIEELRDKVEQALKPLIFRERMIIMLRSGLGDGYSYTLAEVGRIFGVTRERVRQIEAKALRKLGKGVASRFKIMDHRRTTPYT
jgi:RNA polymerase sigma factor (sigma-70 family)